MPPRLFLGPATRAALERRHHRLDSLHHPTTTLNTPQSKLPFLFLTTPVPPAARPSGSLSLPLRSPRPAPTASSDLASLDFVWGRDVNLSAARPVISSPGPAPEILPDPLPTASSRLSDRRTSRRHAQSLARYLSRVAPRPASVPILHHHATSFPRFAKKQQPSTPPNGSLTHSQVSSSSATSPSRPSSSRLTRSATTSSSRTLTTRPWSSRAIDCPSSKGD